MPAMSHSGTIHLLAPDVVSRIAAGEVIERPAAVVKELVENSLDAGSTRISVDVRDGGVSFIRVTDDGEGISRADLPLAFERHATSKLRSDADLTSIRTMGFRGEALPSIASVSRVQVTTATRQEDYGTRLMLVGGVREDIADAAPVPGTKIEVSDLFYNQPARKKFLKSTATEFSRISHVLQQTALAWPSVHIRLTHNGQEVLNYPPVTSDRDRILQVYRPAFLDKSIEVQGRMAGCAISGIIVDPVHARSSRTPQDLFVNRRPIRNAAVFHAVADGYGSSLPKGSNPTFVLFIEITPEQIDVNVHPAKREIRFTDQEAVHQFVRHVVRHAIGGPERKLVLNLNVPQDKSKTGIESVFQAKTDPSPGPMVPQQSGNAENSIPSRRASTLSPSTDARSPASLFAQEAGVYYGEPAAPLVMPFGQLRQTYLVAQVGQELQVIDQHTAHERVLFERLLRKWRQRQIVSQPLLIPEPVELSVAHSTLVEAHCGNLEQLGLVIEPFGGTTMVIRAVPAGIGPFNAVLLMQDLLEDLSQWNSTSSLEARVEPILASLACRSAVQAGRSLALPEIEQLIRDWVEEGLVTTCPHGRRTVFRLSGDELDKLFGRVGWS